MKIRPFKLERFFAKYEFKAPYILCASDCESFSIQELLNFDSTAEKALRSLWLGYTEAQGNPQLRGEITKLYQRINPDEILVHTGGEEGIFLFMQTALEKGDHVIVQFPCYQSLFEIAKAMGCEVTKWEMEDKNNWSLDFVRRKGVLLLPSNYYDFGKKHFRIGFGRKNLPEAIEEFEEYVKENY